MTTLVPLSARAGQGRPSLPPRHLADLDPPQRRAAVAELGEAPYRAEQLARDYFRHGLLAPLTGLSASARDRLRTGLLPTLLTEVRSVSCDGGRTRKTLWRCHDGATVESVVMRYPDRVTVCVSSQAGCAMGCPFCATGQGGLLRNLSRAEIIAQVVEAAVSTTRGDLGEPARLSHVVFMGMGEPLANVERVIGACRSLSAPAPHGLGLSQRHLTVSTVGLVPGIARLTDAGLAVTLAVSLHAADDDLRSELVPVNQRWPVRDVLAAATGYAERTGRRLTVEYALIAGVNDGPRRGGELARLLAGRGMHVNLIPLNPTPGSSWSGSSPEEVARFAHQLRAAGIATTVRDTRGREIAGACGQLAAAVGE